jgi:hypothetical protein
VSNLTEKSLENDAKLSKEKEEKQSKFQNLLDKYFFKIFNPSHLLYTLIFFLSAIIVSMLSLIPGMGDVILFLAVTLALTFIILTVMGLIPQLHDFLFSKEKNFDKNKIFSFLIAFGISFVIVLLYFIFGSSSNLSIEFFGWDILLPPILVIIYFGWNVIQIFFLKTGFDSISVKANNKLLPEDESSDFAEVISWSFLVLAIITPIFIQIGGMFGFAQFFTPAAGEPQDPLYWFIAWNIGMFATIAITSLRLISLFLKSRKNDTPNIYSSVFYILIWLIIWYRSFSFINKFRGQVQTGAITAVSSAIDILLMVATAILVLRGVGGKLYDKAGFNENNMPFFLYAFTLLYIEGQVVIFTGAGSFQGLGLSLDQISMLSNFLTFLVSVGFYLWYSEYSLQRKGLILRSQFVPSEVIEILRDYRKYLKDKDAVKSDKLSEEDFEKFLEEKNIFAKGIEEREFEKDKSKDRAEKKKESKKETEDREIEKEEHLERSEESEGKQDSNEGRSEESNTEKEKELS